MTSATQSVSERLKECIRYRTSQEVLEAAKVRFEKDFENHRLEVVHADGLYRHLRLRRPDTSMYWFEIVTWPGSLVVNGDMGTFTFSRLADMFEFFRGERINPQYWAEKLQGSERATEYSADRFREHVSDALSWYAEELEVDAGGDTEGLFEKLLTTVSAELLPFDGYEDEARRALDEVSTDSFSFHDSWEWNLSEYTIHFLWSCHALVAAIRLYDEAKQAN